MDNKITLELTADDAFWLQQFCSDAASVWYANWRKAKDDESSNLDVGACERLNDRAWSFANRIRDLRSVQ